MRNKFGITIIKNLLIAGALVILTTGCTMFNDNLSPCPVKDPSGAEVTFTYKQNMLGADAFDSQVHCIDLYVFDSNGKLVSHTKETDNSLIKQGNYSTTLYLNPGTYQALAYGGLACQDSSFDPLFKSNEQLTINEMKIKLDKKFYTSSDEKDNVVDKLHDLFYGYTSFQVNEETISPVNIDMMKDTNIIHISLQNVSGEPIDVYDFDFTIKDNNGLLDYKNNIISDEDITYLPFRKYNSFYDDSDADNLKSYTAVASFAVSKLSVDNTPKLIVKNNLSEAEDPTVLEIPLINYILLFKEAYHSEMTDQDYLDRENEWNFIFFLDDTKQSWAGVQIIVGDWTVRVDNVKAEN